MNVHLLLKNWIEKEIRFPHKGDDLLFQLLHDPRFGLDPLYIQQKSIELYQKNRGKGGPKNSLRTLIAAEMEPLLTLFDTVDPHPIYPISKKLEDAIAIWNQLPLTEQDKFLVTFWEDFKEDASTKNPNYSSNDAPIKIQLLPDNLLQPLLDRYSLSVSHLNSFLQCPLKFYYQNLIRVPSAGNESMSFGSAVHEALEQLFQQMKRSERKFPPVDFLIDSFFSSMKKKENEFSPESFLKKLDYGKQILTAYYEQQKAQWNTIVIVEKTIRTQLDESISINGIMDKLEFNGKNLAIVDYKTGSHAKALLQLHVPTENNANGGDYWRQAIFYKILIDQDPGNDWNTTHVTFDFIEPVNGIFQKETVPIDAASVTTVKQQIRKVWSLIKSKAFDTGCGKPDCHWCNFIQSNQLNISSKSSLN